MLRHIAEPFDARGFHADIGVESFGDGMTNHRLPLFLEQLNEPPLLRHQCVNLRRLVVKEGGDGTLFGERG